MLKKSVKSKIAVLVLSLTMLLGTASLAMAGVTPVDKAAASNVAAPQSIEAIHYYVTGTTYIRSGPGTSYSILRTVYAGETVWYNSELTDYHNGWTPVYIGSTEGYILDSKIQEY
jgi:uncharacterized protein YgiM (DUF1202 family)